MDNGIATTVVRGTSYRPLRPIEGVIYFFFLTRFVFYVSFVIPSGMCVAILEGIGPITAYGTIH